MPGSKQSAKFNIIAFVVVFFIFVIICPPVRATTNEPTTPTPTTITPEPENQPPEKNTEINDQKAVRETESGDTPATLSAPLSAAPATGPGTGNTPPDPVKTTLRIDTNPATGGTFLFSYPITVPPDRGGLGPELSLGYSSQEGDRGSPVGHGWNLSIPTISRVNRHGVDRLYVENDFVSSLSGELVGVSLLADGTHGIYGDKVEQGSFLSYEYTSNGVWVVTDKHGVRYMFGDTGVSRVFDPADRIGKIHTWYLSEIRDTNDNYVRYEYVKDGNRVYPSRVVYTGHGSVDGIFAVSFSREARPDVEVSYALGFAVTTSYRMNQIEVAVNGVWVRRYDLAYTLSTNTNPQSVLDRIVESGRDEETGMMATMPSTVFEYQHSGKSFTTSTDWTFPNDVNGDPVVLSTLHRDSGVRLADVNGDGLVDLAQAVYLGSTAPGAPVQSLRAIYRNTGGGWVYDAALSPPTDFIDNNISDLGTRLADVNGDGLVDFLVGRDCGSTNCPVREVYLHTGSGSSPAWARAGAGTWDLPVDFVNGGGRDSGARVVDVNGDGLPDIVLAREGTGRLVYLNTGYGWVTSTSWTVPVDFMTRYYEDLGVRMGDVNGDGLVDLVQADGYSDGRTWDLHQNVYLNTGGGWVLDPAWIIPSDIQDTPIRFTSLGRQLPWRLLDVTNDHLPDLVIASEAPLRREVYVNTGNTWVYDPNWVLPISLTTNGPQDLGTTVDDVNGDGIVDVAKLEGGRVPPALGVYNRFVYLGHPMVPDLLSTIAHAAGATTRVTYQSSAQYTVTTTTPTPTTTPANPRLPLILQTVKEISVQDGLGTTSTVQYAYEGGQYYFASPFDRMFAGFHTVTRDDGMARVKTYYHEGDGSDAGLGEYDDHIAKRGRVYREEVRGVGDNLYSSTVTKWEQVPLVSASVSSTRYFVKKTRVLNQTYGGSAGGGGGGSAGTHRDTGETYVYDDTNGNLTSQIAWGEVVGVDTGEFTDVGNDEYVTTIQYAQPVTPGGALIGLAYQETIMDQSNTQVKKSKYIYDNLPFGQVTVGNVTQEEAWIGSDGGGGDQYAVARKSYNAYGLPTSTIDPNGHTTTFGYDTGNLYPLAVTNALGQVTSYGYDYSLGKARTVTDPNGARVETVYDGLDRVVEEKIPDTACANVPAVCNAQLVTKTMYTYTDNVFPRSVHRVDFLSATNMVDTYVYLDGLDRSRQTRKEMVAGTSGGGGGGSGDSGGDAFSVVATDYDARGLVWRMSLPYARQATPAGGQGPGYEAQTTSSPSSSLYTITTYDPLGRPLTVTNAVGTTTYGYDAWKTTAVDPLGRPKDMISDAYGNLVAVNEYISTHPGSSRYNPGTGTMLTTRYEYNGLNKLTKITDANGNVRNFGYDELGRRVMAEDTHDRNDATFGIWRYTYDLA
ncbi:VCBS repeat-containing protein, partial [Candidatus Falkowbacteria bacterium]|nr:VCBS repeat-containing protein [Candidatus Falkowbacteria bacterium]